MSRKLRLGVGRALLLGAAGCALVILVNCLADPREEDAVAIVDKCDVASLSTDPKAPQSSLKAYVDATETLLARATAVAAALSDACNAIDTDLKLPTGTDVTSACFPISGRIGTILKNEPPAAPGALAANHFKDIAFPSTCKTPPGTLETCLGKCAGACDTSKCPAEKLAGLCAGDCVGSCTETGDVLPCNGRCVGETGLDGGGCQGECVGRCAAPAWTGKCAATCTTGFSGFCEGTCTGTCNGSPVGDAGGPPVDAGTGDADPDAEAGPPPGPPPVKPPPGGADGNCPGVCVGLCSSGANGNCGSQCLTFADGGPPFGNFSAGFCGGGGVGAGCTGACRVGGAAGNGSTGTCTGTCTQVGRVQCNGVCRVVDGGGCNGTLSNAVCEGTVACGQNAECANACQATALLAAVCAEPKASQIILVTDQALYDSLVKHQGALGKATNELLQLRKALAFIGNRSFGDFSVIGISGDVGRACVNQGRSNVEQAQKLISAALAANPVSTQKSQ